MNILTKFNINEKVYVMNYNEIKYKPIESINIKISQSLKIKITYWISGIGHIDEKLIYKTKEELINNL